MKNASNIIPFNSNQKGKSRLTGEDIYQTCYSKWIHIPRACDSSKTIVHEAIWYIATIEYLLIKNPKEVVFSWDLLTEKTKAKERQIKRYLEQLSNIYDIKYHRGKYSYNGKTYRSIFSATRTEDSVEILANPKLFYKQQKKKNNTKKTELKSVENTQNCPFKRTKITSQNCPSKLTNLSSSTIYTIETRQKELEKIPFRYIFSNSILNVERTCVDTNSEIVSQPIPTTKPRIRVQAGILKTSTLVTEQTDLLCYPEGAASQSCSTKNEEYKLESVESVTNCHELEQNKINEIVVNSDESSQSGQTKNPEVSRYGEYHNETNTTPNVRENRTTEPLQPAYSSRGRHYTPRKTQHFSGSKDVASLSELLSEMLDSNELPTEPESSTNCLQLESQPLQNQGLPLNEYLGQLNRPIPKNTDEDTMKAYNWDNPANKLDLAIARNFDVATAQGLTCEIDYCYLEAESKIRLDFKKKLSMSEQNKSRLKQIIRDVYGDNTEIVYTLKKSEKTTVAKTTHVQEKFSDTTHKAAISNLETTTFNKQQPPKRPSHEEMERRLKEFYDNQFAQRSKELEEEKAKKLELENSKSTEIFSPLATEIFAKRKAEREAKNPSKINVEEEVKRALAIFEEEQRRKNIPQCQFMGLAESSERPLPHIKVPECWNINKQ